MDSQVSRRLSLLAGQGTLLLMSLQRTTGPDRESFFPSDSPDAMVAVAAVAAMPAFGLVCSYCSMIFQGRTGWALEIVSAATFLFWLVMWVLGLLMRY